jgi:hypothetical protein
MDFLRKVFAGTLASLLGRLLAEEVKARGPDWTEFFAEAAVHLLPERFSISRFLIRLGNSYGQRA